ncbi:MAG: glutathione peroxidase [Burkholderiales bacterium]|nr:glutathione peroxidase [Burkholderiales bacterium]
MNASNVHEFSVSALDGGPMPLSQYVGRPLLIVNTASRCGFTPQYQGLERLWQTYGPRGLVVLGFPCNQFGAQEPGSADEIAVFCSTSYDVTFPMAAKIDVNGAGAAPLYRYLRAAAPEADGRTEIPWNFTKFLVDRQGRVVARYASADTPASLAAPIEALL